MPLTLFGSPGSGSAANEMALRAASLNYHTVQASTWEPGPGLDALRRVNPLSKIPTLVLPDDTVLTESAAILIHLGLEHPHAKLLPEAPSERAQTIRWLVFIAANCYSAVSVSDYPERWTTVVSKPAHAPVRAAARAQLHRHWEIFADTFDRDAALSADPPGALAFLAVVVSQWSGARQHLQSIRPHSHAALLQWESHPRIAIVLQEHRGQ